jgi:hypothetical protein
VPAELANLCHKLLAKKPNDRIQSAAEVAGALSEWLNRYETAIGGGAPATRFQPLPLSASRAPAPLSRGSTDGDELTLAEDDETQPAGSAPGSTAHSPPATDRAPTAEPEQVPVPSSSAELANDWQSSLLDELPPLAAESDPLNSTDFLGLPTGSLPALAPADREAKPQTATSWSQTVQGLVATQTEEGVFVCALVPHRSRWIAGDSRLRGGLLLRPIDEAD